MRGFDPVFFFLCLFALTGCGGDSNGDSPASNATTNVALQSNGGTADASYDPNSASLVNDGDTTASVNTAWVGDQQGSNVTVSFDQRYELEKLVIYTSSSAPDQSGDLEIQLSNDNGSSFTAVNYNNDCSDLVIESSRNRISCTLASPTDATDIRVEIAASSNISSIEIYEIQAKT